MELAKRLIGYDHRHLRLDLRQIPAHIITLLLALWWAFHDDYSGTSVIMRIIIAAAFLTVTRLTVGRLGASRLSSVLTSLLVIVFFWKVTGEMLVELTVFMAGILGTVEYFKTRNKFLAAGYGVMLGILSAVLPDKKGVLLLTVFLGVLLARTLWHAVVERLSKIQLVLFAGKALVIAVIAIGLYMLLGTHLYFGWAWQSYVALPPMSPSFLALVVVLALWGLWATMLLATPRSPKHRGMRLFFLVFSLGVIGVVGTIRAYGPDTLQAGALQVLAQAGLTTYNAQVMIFAIFTLVLLATAGIDRALYKDTEWVRSICAKLGEKFN